MLPSRLPLLIGSLVVAVLVAAFGVPLDDAPAPPLFTRLSSSETGITFSNDLEEGPEVNVLAYEYLYNGGGVAASDLSRTSTSRPTRRPTRSISMRATSSFGR